MQNRHVGHPGRKTQEHSQEWLCHEKSRFPTPRTLFGMTDVVFGES
jgi:hypothetical protein